MSFIYYILRSSPFGSFAVVWSFAYGSPGINRIILSRPGYSAEERLEEYNYPIVSDSCPQIDQMAEKISRFLHGMQISFDLDCIRLEICPAFQQKVLLTEYQIPYGYISTYQGIAKQLHRPTASRAVGNALANNPFPVIIPCHRAIRSDLTLGGYQGGIDMKRSLLEYEGHIMDNKMRMIQPIFYHW